MEETEERSRSRQLLEGIVTEGALLVILILLFIYVFLTTPTRLGEALDFGVNNLIDIVPIFIVASLLAGWADIWIDKEAIAGFFEKRGLIAGLVIITCIGVATPGPIFAIFPILVVFVRKGINAHYIFAYSTGQTLMGPLRIPLEIYYLGWGFFLFRVLSSILLGVFAGLCVYPISKRLDKVLLEATDSYED
jgi:uncharacterized membrane protein YraQ (UPF0718 family)